MKQRGKKKKIKRKENNLRDLWGNVKCPNIWIIDVPEEEDKKKGHEKILEEIVVKNFPTTGKEIATQFQETQTVPNRINPSWKKPKTHINQTNKNQTQRANIKSNKIKSTNKHKGIPIRVTVDLSIETLQAKGNRRIYLKWWKRKTHNQDYSTQERSYSDMKEKSKTWQTSKSWDNSAPPNQFFNKCWRIFSRQETQKRFIKTNPK